MLIVEMINHLLKKKHTFFLGLICIATILILFLVGLWPLNFHPKNEVEWLPDKNGIHFYGKGIVYSSELLEEQKQNLFPNNSISIELYLQPDKVLRRHFAYIFTLYDGDETEHLTVGRWNNTLQVLGRRIISKEKIEFFPKIGLSHALPDREDRFITLSSDEKGTSIYINGKLTKFFPKYSLISQNQFKNGQIILGNSSNGRNPWNGNIFSFAIYNRLLGKYEVLQNYQAWLKHGYQEASDNKGLVLFYRFNEHKGIIINNHLGQHNDLLIPTTFHVPRKTVLSLPWRDFKLSLSYFTDVFINIVGFIPFGFFFFAFLNNIKQDSGLKNYLLTLLLGGAISLSIELTQVYLPTRSSSLTDLICNMLGTIAGLIMFSIVVRFSNVRVESSRDY